MVSRLRQSGSLVAFAGSDDEESGPKLWNAVVGGIKHLPVAGVSSGIDLGAQPVESGPARSVVKGECVDILKYEVFRLGLSEDAVCKPARGWPRDQCQLASTQAKNQISKRQRMGVLRRARLGAL